MVGNLPRRFTLGWSHYVELLTLDDAAERRFYEIEAAANQWSVRELQRQIARRTQPASTANLSTNIIQPAIALENQSGGYKPAATSGDKVSRGSPPDLAVGKTRTSVYRV
jgi:hypothetical protein